MRWLSKIYSTAQVVDPRSGDPLGFAASPVSTLAALACMTILAVSKLGSEFYRLVWETGA